jgi:hypothetical protein
MMIITYDDNTDDDYDNDESLIISMNLYVMNIMIQLHNVDVHDDSILFSGKDLDLP